MEPLETEDFTIRELRDIVQKASRDNPHLTSRLEKAAFLVLLRPIEPLGDHHFQVMSEDGLRYYEVINGHCQCHDYVRHGSGHPCKHRLALAIVQRLEPLGPPIQSPQGSVCSHECAGVVLGPTSQREAMATVEVDAD